MKPNNNRKIHVIEKEIQNAFAKEIIFSFIVFAFVLVANISIPSILEHYGFIGRDGEYASFLKGFLSISTFLWPSLLIGTALLAVTSFYRSHLLAGPIYRFKKTTESIGEGQINHRVQLRKDDFMKEFQIIYNRTIETLDKKISNTKKYNRQAIQSIDALCATSQDPQLTEIKEILKNMQKELAYFKTSYFKEDIASKLLERTIRSQLTASGKIDQLGIKPA